MVGRVTRVLTAGRVAAVRNAETRACGRPGDIAGRLDALRADLERERYLQLLPGYVRRFAEKGAALLDLEIRGDLDGAFSLRPRRTGASTRCRRRSKAIRPPGEAGDQAGAEAARFPQVHSAFLLIYSHGKPRHDLNPKALTCPQNRGDLNR